VRQPEQGRTLFTVLISEVSYADLIARADRQTLCAVGVYKQDPRFQVILGEQAIPSLSGCGYKNREPDMLSVQEMPISAPTSCRHIDTRLEESSL
jgi:hypothetical protein